MDRKYSVLMSVYYKENPIYLSESINSMINQTEKTDQIVIVEDGKLTEELHEIIHKYEKDYPTLFTIVKLKENGGLGRALNYGLEACRNELVARMDTDDISLADRCEKQLNAFEHCKKLCICGTQIDEFLSSPNNLISTRKVPLRFTDIKKFAKKRSPFNHPTVMYKKSKVLSAGGYAEYGRKEDLDLFVRMVMMNFYSINLNESLLLYRTSTDNLERRKSWKNCSEYISVMFKFYRKGYLNIFDILYVVIGQVIMYSCPETIVKYLSNKFLRSKVTN